MSTLTGTSQNETLIGGSGSDTISAGAGNDTVIGDSPSNNNIIENGTFEGNALESGWNSAVPTGWVYSGNRTSAWPIGSQVAGFGDRASLYLDTANINGKINGVEQNTGVTYQSTATYNLTVDVGSQAYNTSPVTVQFLVGTTVVATQTYQYPVSSRLSMVSNAINLTISPGATTATGAMTVRIFNTSSAGTNAQSIIDNVSLTTTGNTGGAADTLTGGDGLDTIYGGEGDDAIYGDDTAGTGTTGSADTIYGGVGNDTVIAGAGADNVFGDAGDDNLTGNAGNDTITGGDGLDTIYGGADNDTIYGDDTAGTGTTGSADTIYGGAGNDTVIAGAGADNVFGDAGDDNLTGNAGNDTITGGDGLDTIYGGADNDTIYGDDTAGTGTTGSADTIYGGAGNDTVIAGAGADNVFGDAGDDNLTGNAGNDTITGGDGIDTIYGGTENDTIYGDDTAGTGTTGSADTIYGGAGNDTVIAGAGNDTITGGTGDDTLTGNAGNDLFKYTAGDGKDVLTDFGTGSTNINDGDKTNNDYIDLTAFYTNTFELRADLADDGIANQSVGNYADNTSMGGGSITGLSALLGMSKFSIFEQTGIQCFVRGTMILTKTGEKPIEKLRVGDEIHTLDHGLQPIRWIGSRKLTATDLAQQPKWRPIRIAAGALGANTPNADLFVSPQHRILIKSNLIAKITGGKEALISAKQLCEVDGIEVDQSEQGVKYFHILFDQHEIISSNNAFTESFYTGAQAVKSLDDAARAEIYELFPELARDDHEALTCRPLITGAFAREIAQRHVKNNHPICP